MTGKSTRVLASNKLNHQSWTGTDDGRYGYGSMFQGFRDNAPTNVQFDAKASTQVHMGIPTMFEGKYLNQFVACFTMWETTVLPSDFVRYLKLFDRIIVPCQHNVELFSQHHSDVVHVPLGVDTGFWFPQQKTQNEKFRFQAAGSLWRRKGLDVLVDVFNKLGLPNTELHIKAAPQAHDAPTHHLGDNVFLHRKWLNQSQQRDWFGRADCFVAPSRGEGFGLIPLQAIAMGIPTIMSTSTGQGQFAHLATHRIGYSKVRADTIGLWDEPNRDDLAAAMLNVWENRHDAWNQAQTDAARAEEFSWAKASEKLVRSVPAGVVLKPAVWEDAFVEVAVRALRPVKANIAGVDYRMKTGETCVIPDGAYQVLFDSRAVEMV